MDKRKKYKKIKNINTVLFIILFIVSYISIFFIGRISIVPSINTNKNETSENGDSINNDTSESSDSINNETSENGDITINDEIQENPEPITIRIFGNGKQWTQSNELNIFDNPFFDNNIIAPGIKHRYNLKIENMSNKKIIYFIKFKEENDKQINLKYRLKKNNEYILGNNDEWVYIDNVTTNNFVLDKNSIEDYVLDWYWEDSDTDTVVGKDKSANYKINIEICSGVIRE